MSNNVPTEYQVAKAEFEAILCKDAEYAAKHSKFEYDEAVFREANFASDKFSPGSYHDNDIHLMWMGFMAARFGSAIPPWERDDEAG